MMTRMTKYFKIKFPDGTFEIVKGLDMEDVILQYGLYTEEHTDTRVVELTGEQRAIAASEDDEDGEETDE
jgi:hypothetical protein